MATRLVPLLTEITDYTQAQENTLATALVGKGYGFAVIFNTSLNIVRIWNGTVFINQPLLPPAIVPAVIDVVNNQTTNYNLQITDIGNLITCNKATAFVLGIPNDATLNFPIGVNIRFLQSGAGQINFIAVAPAVLISYGAKTKTAGLYARAILTKVAANIWSVWGETSV